MRVKRVMCFAPDDQFHIFEICELHKCILESVFVKSGSKACTAVNMSWQDNAEPREDDADASGIVAGIMGLLDDDERKAAVRSEVNNFEK